MLLFSGASSYSFFNQRYNEQLKTLKAMSALSKIIQHTFTWLHLSLYLGSVSQRQHLFTFVTAQVFPSSFILYLFAGCIYICDTKRQIVPRLISCWWGLPSSPSPTHIHYLFPFASRCCRKPTPEFSVLEKYDEKKPMEGNPSSFKSLSEFLLDLGRLLAAFLKYKGRLHLS